MTSYSVPGPPPTFSQSGSTQSYSATFQLALTAVSFPIKINKIERAGANTTNILSYSVPAPYLLKQYIGTTVSSGGGTVTPNPLRAGAAAASATCRYATSSASYNTSTATGSVSSTALTLSGGSNTVLHSEAIATGVESDYQFPNDYIMAVGSTFLISGTVGNGSIPPSTLNTVGYWAFNTVVIYFEELHLARST